MQPLPALLHVVCYVALQSGGARPMQFLCYDQPACIQLTTLLDSAADCTSCDVQLTYVTCARYLCFLCLPMMCVLAYVCILAVLFGSGGIFNYALGSCIVRVAVVIAAVLLSFSLGLGFACRTIM